MNYTLDVLKNGLRVVTIPMRERRSTSVAIWVKAGSRYESKSLAGVSHFLEHMLFKGTPTRTARQIKEQIEGVGGMLNAFTGEESTCYFAKLLNEHYPKALTVLADMVNHATLEAKEFQRERTVILEEIKMYRDLPSHHVHDMMGELLWPKQPLGRPISGSMKTVSRMTRTQMLSYKKRFYQPCNIVVSVAGPVKAHEVRQYAEESFSKKSSGKAPSYTKAISKQSRPQTSFVQKQSEQTHLVIGFHGLSRFDRDRYKLGMLHILMGGNMSSRLFEEVREKRGLAYEVRTGAGFYHDAGSFSVSAGVDPKKAKKAIALILKELKKVTRVKVGKQELRRAKDYYLSQFYMALEDTLDHLLWAGERVVDQGQLPDQKAICRAIESVTVEDVHQVAKRILKNSHMNLSLIGPINEKEALKMKRDFEL